MRAEKPLAQIKSNKSRCVLCAQTEGATDENFMAKQASKQTSRYQQNVLIKGDHAFYAGDNDEQKQMKLRKFSLASGEQLAGAPFRDLPVPQPLTMTAARS